MEYSMNSVGIQCNSFVNYQPFVNYDLIPNSQNSGQIQCCSSNQTLIEPTLPPTLESNFNQRRLYVQRQRFSTFSSMPSPSTKLSSNFTIASILGNEKSQNLSISSPTITSETNSNINIDNNNEDILYNWLSCTRYRPPKVKKRSNSVGKRKPVNRGPRIPFTSCQITELENKFNETHYLSSLEVTYLAQKLNLTDSRIRIWFQNRRAREKREEREDRAVVESHLTNVDKNYLMNSLDKRKTAPVASHETTFSIESHSKEVKQF